MMSADPSFAIVWTDLVTTHYRQANWCISKKQDRRILRLGSSGDRDEEDDYLPSESLPSTSPSTPTSVTGKQGLEYDVVFNFPKRQNETIEGNENMSDQEDFESEIRHNSLYQRVLEWLTINRTKSKDWDRSAKPWRNRELPHHGKHATNGKTRDCGLAKKRLKLLLRNAEKAVREREEISRKLETPDSGFFSAGSSAPHTPSTERDSRFHNDSLVKSISGFFYDRKRSSCSRRSSGILSLRALRNAFSLDQSETKLRRGKFQNLTSLDEEIFECHQKSHDEKARKIAIKSYSWEREATVNHDMCNTWPPAHTSIVLAIDEEDPESGFNDLNTDINTSYPELRDNLDDSLGDWSIPFSDLRINEIIRRGRFGSVYRGRWHGEVMIYSTDPQSALEVSQFWKDVSALCKIRHENISLFMGACVTETMLAIVISVHKGASLYEHIRIRRTSIPLLSKINIARQIAQAMGYLHAKGILHKKLNSRNVFLESKVKLCLVDNGMAEKMFDRSNYGCLPQGHLTYISPEMMRSLSISPPWINYGSGNTFQNDIYAFGTLLYELLAGHWPFPKECPEVIIYRIGKGHCQQLDDLKCSSSLKVLLNQCWSENPRNRPLFMRIVRELHHNISLHKRHSSSEPERLNRLGFGQTRVA